MRDKIQIKNIKKLSFDFCSPRKTLSIEKSSESYVTSITSILEKKFRCTDQLVISSNLTQRKREGQVSRCYPLIFFFWIFVLVFKACFCQDLRLMWAMGSVSLTQYQLFWCIFLELGSGWWSDSHIKTKKSIWICILV